MMRILRICRPTDSPASASVTLVLPGVADPRARRPALGVTFVPSWAGERVRIRSGCHPQGPPTGPGDFLFEHLFGRTVDQDSNRVLHGLHGSVSGFVRSIG